ncbi:MAG: ribbon-helix-helix domain-containing protein [Deltaproteobacteria bacterium]|nr:ribbon-helix-helix domain-containing protein [Deltaproteobacteria bacterium]
MPQLALYLDETTARRVDEASRQEGSSRSAWVRRAIASFLAGNDDVYDLSTRSIGSRLTSELREPTNLGEGEHGSVLPSGAEGAFRQAQLEAFRQGRGLGDLVSEAVTNYLESQGRRVEEDPVASGWGALSTDSETLSAVLQEDFLRDG